MTSEPPHEQPGAWLRELARLKPAPWEWGRAIRSALCIALPWAAGIAFDAMMVGMWVSLGALMAAAGEPGGSYHTKLRQVLGATLIGASGFLAGYLDPLPLAAIVVIMTAAGFAAGILSFYGAILSIGTMQALLLASIAIGVPTIASFWQAALLFFAGALIYAAALAVEALIVGSGQRRALIASLLRALAAFARRRSGGPDGSPAVLPVGAPEAASARQAVTSQIAALCAHMLSLRSGSTGPSREADRLAAVVHGADVTFAAILSASDAGVLAAAAEQLDAAANALGQGAKLPPMPQGGAPDALFRALGGLFSAIDDDIDAIITPTPHGAGAPPREGTRAGRLRIAIDRLAPGGDAVRTAIKLALCMGLAYSTRYVNDANHWFWVPLTVSLVMKPDLGSIFARAVLRSVGTVGGAAIAVLVLGLLAKGPVLVVVMALLAGLLPWSMRRSYALQALVLTPLVLVLVDLLTPGPVNIDFGLQRVADTVVAGIIVLIFGYFIWPRTHGRALAISFRAAKHEIATYLRAIADGEPGPQLSGQRRAAYGSLADMRARLQISLMEPPPACDEAASWFPLIAAAERICDRVTAYSARAEGPPTPADAATLRELAAYIAARPDDRPGLLPPRRAGADAALMTLFDGVVDELAHMVRLRESGHLPEAPHPAGRMTTGLPAA